MDVEVLLVRTTTLEQRLNIWCDACLLPSGYDCTFAVSADGNPCGVLHIAGCTECGPC